MKIRGDEDVRVSPVSSVEEIVGRIEVRLVALEERLSRESVTPRALTMARAAALLSVSVSTVKRLVKGGELRTVTLGARPMVPMSEVVRLTSVTAAPSSRPQGPGPVRGSAEAAKIRSALRG